MTVRVISGLLLFLGLGLARADGQSRPVGSIAEQYLFAAANAERAERGLPALHWDGALYRAASGHAQQMAARESISHQYPGEPELAERGKSAGARFSRIAENVAEASTAVRIHDAWMHSPGHRENLLDPSVDSVGISVLQRRGQLYAVQDFGRTVTVMSLEAQEQTVARMVASAGPVAMLPSSEDSRRTCAMNTGYAGERQPTFVMRYTSGDLMSIPQILRTKLATGSYRHATVGACAAASKQPFSSYSIAVILYP